MTHPDTPLDASKTKPVTDLCTDPGSPRTGREAYEWSRQLTKRPLRRAGYDPDTDEGLAEVLRRSTKEWHLVAALDLIGSRDVLKKLAPRLEELCEFPFVEVQNAALSNLLWILRRREGMVLLRRLAASRGFHAKWFLFSEICNLGYRVDVPLVAGYVRAILRRGTLSGLTGTGTSLSDYCAFLDEFIDAEPVVQKLYDWIRSRWDRLDRVDRKSLERRQPYFRRSTGQRWVLFVGDGRIGSRRLANVFYSEGGKFGLLLQDDPGPRFRSTFLAFTRHAHVIIAIGPRAERRLKRVWTEGMPPVVIFPTPEYERQDDERTGWPRNLTSREWCEAASEEDRKYIREFRKIVVGA